jgi:hypothetical protein
MARASGPAHRAGSSRSAGPVWVLLGVVLTAVVTLVAAELIAARRATIPAPVLSQQVAGVPPLQNLIQDQGSSVALPDGRTLWIFADTANLHGSPRFFVTSSAGLAVGDDLRLHYLTDPSGTPIEFLPRTPEERANQQSGVHYTAIWPTGATALPDGRIVIAYTKYAVQMKPTVRFDFLAGGLFQYRYPGADGLAPTGSAWSDQPATRLANDIWTPLDGPIASPVYYQGYIYFTRCQDFHCYSLRSPPGALADRAAYRWWTGTGWSVDARKRARVSFGSDVPGRNPSIAYSPKLRLFVMTDTSGGIQSSRGLLWVARDPWGPWSRAAGFPLPQCPSAGCYTLNVHPEQSPAGTLRVSFATNGLGPYVRVVDLPIRVNDRGPIPSISAHDTGPACPASGESASGRPASGSAGSNLTSCPNP